MQSPVQIAVVVRQGDVVLRTFALAPFVASTISTHGLPIVGHTGNVALELEGFTYSPRVRAMLPPSAWLVCRIPRHDGAWHSTGACPKGRRVVAVHGLGGLKLATRIPRGAKRCRTCQALERRRARRMRRAR